MNETFSILIHASLKSLAIVFIGCTAVNEFNLSVSMREVRAAIESYAYQHGGALPSSLSALAKELPDSDLTYKWDELYYTAGLTKDDPSRMPIVMSDPKKKSSRGMALLLGGSVLRYRELSSQEIDMVVHRPWEYVRDEFTDPREYEEFRKRVTVLLPQSNQPSEGFKP